MMSLGEEVVPLQFSVLIRPLDFLKFRIDSQLMGNNIIIVHTIANTSGR